MQKNNSFSNRSNHGYKKSGKGNWFRVPNALIDFYGKALNPSGLAVYCVLARYANNLTKQAFPSHGHIAKTLGISRRTVLRKLKKLLEMGLIKRLKRKQSYCVYIIE